MLAMNLGRAVVWDSGGFYGGGWWASDNEDCCLSPSWHLVTAGPVVPLACRPPGLLFLPCEPPIWNNCSHFVFHAAVIFAQGWAPFSSLLTEMGSDRLNKSKSLCQGNRYSFSRLLSRFLFLSVTLCWESADSELTDTLKLPIDPCPTNLIRRETFIPCYSSQGLSADVIEGLGITPTSADWPGTKGHWELGPHYGGEGHPIDKMGNYKGWRSWGGCTGSCPRISLLVCFVNDELQKSPTIPNWGKAEDLCSDRWTLISGYWQLTF